MSCFGLENATQGPKTVAEELRCAQEHGINLQSLASLLFNCMRADRQVSQTLIVPFNAALITEKKAETIHTLEDLRGPGGLIAPCPSSCPICFMTRFAERKEQRIYPQQSDGRLPRNPCDLPCRVRLEHENRLPVRAVVRIVERMPEALQLLANASNCLPSRKQNQAGVIKVSMIVDVAGMKVVKHYDGARKCLLLFSFRFYLVQPAVLFRPWVRELFELSGYPSEGPW